MTRARDLADGKHLTNVDSNPLVVDATNNRVGVGLTAPEQPFHVRSSTFAYMRSESTNATYTGLDVGQHQSGYGVINMRDNQDIRFYTNDAEKLRIQAAGGISFNGDTAAANALDDYEEGTFAPAFFGQSANPTVTYGFQRGHYTKIGRTVYFQSSIGPDGVSGGSGALYIRLPFTANSSLESRSGAVGLSYSWATAIPDAKWIIFANQNVGYLYNGDNSGNTVNVNYLDSGSSSNRIWLQGFYDV